MTFKPTAEQQTIIDAATKTKDNLLVKALAGAAKTSTLVLLAEALPQENILCLAFNKKIAVEMTERLPDNCKAQTLNSLGHQVWGGAIGKRLNLKTNKTYSIVKDLIEELPKGSPREKGYACMAEVIKAVDQGKTCGYVPDGCSDRAKPLMNDDEFYYWLDEEPEDEMWDLVVKASRDGITMALQGIIDFGDQLLMPTVFPAPFPIYDLVMVDEAQDLSCLNHAMLRKLVKKRIIAVGDPCQAIYGFRGAHEDSMTLMAEQFEMKEFALTISFRCPRAVVREAQWRAPQMQWPEWAIEGEVRSPFGWTIEDLSSGDAIICRNNAPLFSIALAILRDGKYPEIVGNDICKALIKVLKKFSKNMSMPAAEVHAEIDRWEQLKLQRARPSAKGGVADRADCLRIFAESADDLGGAIAYVEHLMTAAGNIKLMTGHKSKGLEFNTVWFLNEYLIKTDEGQEANLKYVIQTRAMETLIYVTSETYGLEEAERKEVEG